jgi:nucleoside-diphosphate-sugar epimerase
MALRRWPDICRVNVEGTRQLLAAASGGIEKIVVLSSMSAYDGTTQMYGRAKLLIERDAFNAGASVLRPGLVYGPDAQGMVGKLTRLARLPIVPIPGGNSYQYTVHEEDLAAVVSALLVDRSYTPDCPVGVAHPEPVSFARIMSTLARRQGRSIRLFPVPWRLLHLPMVVADVSPLHLPVGSDSILGLVRAAPCVPNTHVLAALGVQPRPFEEDRRSKSLRQI